MKPKEIRGTIVAVAMLVCSVWMDTALGETNTYTFDPNQSTVTETFLTSKTYSVSGTFQLIVDADVASFDSVNVSLSEKPESFPQELGELFYLAELVGDVVNDTTIEFELPSQHPLRQSYDIQITLTLQNGSTNLTGQRSPIMLGEPGFTLEAVAYLPKIIYVDIDAPDDGDGTSWATAYKYLADGLFHSTPGTEIRVAEGVYKPHLNTYSLAPPSRMDTFQLKNGVSIMGGYTGLGEPEPDARDIEQYVAILSGDMNGDDIEVNDPRDLRTEPTRSDNNYHIVNGTGTNSTAVLDGFIITGGNANGSFRNATGAGMYMDDYSSPTVLNCTFIGNSAINGGGMWIEEGGTSIIKNCIFSGNSASNYGGGLYGEDECDFTLINCIFTGNVAAFGGGMYNYGGEISRQSLTNCTFYHNSASSNGGAIFNTLNSSTLTNCILWSNSPDEIYLNRAIVSYSDIQGGWPGEGNIDADPLFVDMEGGGFRLQETSPCINAGNNNAPFLPATDFEGDPRIMYGIVDMGADEVAGNIQLLLNVTIQPFERACTVTLDPAGGVYPFGTEVTITVDAEEGYIFDHWSGDLTGNDNQAMITMDSHKYVTAHFTIDSDVIYVDADATGANNGSSWADAFNLLQDALDIAEYGDQIWVAAGTYKPTSDYGLEIGDRGKHFRMKNNVAIYGGFPNTGDPDWNDRDPERYKTILSGDLAGNDEPVANLEDLIDDPNRSDNCYHVFYHPVETNLDPNAVLDGFIITGGNADTDLFPVTGSGGGMYNAKSSPTISHCTFISNSAANWWKGTGGGMYNEESSTIVTHCIFRGNMCRILNDDIVSTYGGGMSNYHGSPTITHCTFSGNLADCAGGMYASGNTNTTVSNCTFIGNTAYGNGGGMYAVNFNYLTVSNCNFSNNTAESHGGGMYTNGDFTMVSNCTFNGNTAYGTGGGMNVLNWQNLKLSNCTISGNSAGWGGGLRCEHGIVMITNCTISGNMADNWGGGMHCDSDPNLSNCIFWGNTAQSGTQIYGSATVAYSNIQGGWPGVGNIDANPLFVDADGPDDIVGTEDDNLRLTPCSDCLDAGDNLALPATIEEDLDGNSRIVNGIVDMGAYEFPGIVYVDDDAPSDPGPGDFSISDPLECGYPEHPFDAIQEAIDCARNGHTVIVLPGNYSEAFNFIGKSITVTSGEEEPAILEAPGNYAATFHSGEDTNSVLKNFILRNSNIGVFCNHASPTLKYLTVVENTSGIEAWNGSNPQISNSIFWDNDNIDLLFCQAQYSCIERASAGLGNLSMDPLFADPGNGDYHLKSEGWRWRDLVAHGSHWTWDGLTSPCIDTANPGSPLGAEPITIPEDPDNEWGLNLRANMGAFGGTAQASMAMPGWCLQSDTDNDGRTNMKELIMLRDQWLIWEITEPYCDFNRDGIVNLGDYQVLAKEWLREALRIE